MGIVMVVAPHPDDAELAMGGTIAALLQRGERVVVVDLTDGEPTPHGSREIRAKETKAASTVLDITERINLGIPNREIFDTVPYRKLVANEIRRIRPDILFAPYWEDAHPDHVQACALIEAARFYAKFAKGDLAHQPHYPRKLFHYIGTHLRPRLDPSFIIDITTQLDLKIRALECYASQFAVNPANKNFIDRLVTEAKFWGSQVGVGAGEPFACRESIRVMDAAAVLSL